MQIGRSAVQWLIAGQPPGDERRLEVRVQAINRGSVFLAGFALVVATSVGLASPAAAHGDCRSPVERVTDLSASRRVTCGAARKVAAAYDTKVMQGGSFPGQGRVKARGFSCATTSTGHESEESFSVRCTSRRGVVRFVWGV